MTEITEAVEEVIVTPDGLLDLLMAAYERGAHDVHTNYQPDPDPSFTEAAQDYVASLDFTATTRPYRPGFELTRLRAEVEGLRGAVKPFADACEGGDDDTVHDDVQAWESPLALDVTYGDFRRALASITPGEQP